MTEITLAQDKQLIWKLRQVIKAIGNRDLKKLQALLLKKDRPDLNYIVQLSDHGDTKEVTPLLYACGINSPEMVGGLIHAGAKVNCKVWGYSPLSHAISDGKVALVEKLLDCGAIPVKGESDLWKAMELKHDTFADKQTRRGIVALLCKHGVDVNEERLDKPPALHTAVNEGDFAICEILVNSGADKTAVDSAANGNTPLHVAVARKSEVKMVNLLCHENCLNAHNKTGFTPLHLAAEIGDKSTVWTLIQAGADINVQAPETKWTPMDMARHNNNKQVVEYLITCAQSKTEQKEKEQPVFRRRTAPPDNEQSQLKAKNLLLQDEKNHLEERLRAQEEKHQQVVAQLVQETKELKEQNRKLEDCLKELEQQYRDKLYPGGHPMPMSERHRELLTLNRDAFVSDLHISIVITALRKNRVLDQEMEEIICSCRTRNDTNRKLLDILPTRGEAAFYVFRQALREDPGSEHLAVLLNEEDTTQSAY
ncbi:PREDICTED: ankyrin repeat and KH domain-containing protein 1-like [Branchiostoma belcheri]|uniref:Ankyrin repeat and KH domain-containing protein 1-like n=1 Tax=Branchiostoma belcheri TaxID=7741 RepID=A0A6P4ZAG1_BRABE|nr:PREDICTED: ankyrin repeat and KH domain-containing protein 1-like [Branchiostoma belcheri]